LSPSQKNRVSDLKKKEKSEVIISELNLGEKVKQKLELMEKKTRLLKSISNGILRKMKRNGTKSDNLDRVRIRVLRDSLNSNVEMSPTRKLRNKLREYSFNGAKASQSG
jgi:tRNA A37 methylthiotransferase MiaB